MEDKNEFDLTRIRAWTSALTLPLIIIGFILIVVVVLLTGNQPNAELKAAGSAILSYALARSEKG